MAPSRNFRTTYYKTLGVPVVQHIVDVEASYHALFAEPVVNVSQLRKLALEVGVAPSYRAAAWKVLCGVLPTHKCLWELAQNERREMYEDLIDAALVLQLQLPGPEEARLAMTVEDPVESVATTEVESTKKLIRLYHTYRSDVLPAAPLQIIDMSSHDGSIDANALKSIALVLQSVLTDSAVDQFWCFARIIEVLSDARAILDPTLLAEALNDLSAHSLEIIFVRALDHLKSVGRT